MRHLDKIKFQFDQRPYPLTPDYCLLNDCKDQKFNLLNVISMTLTSCLVLSCIICHNFLRATTLTPPSPSSSLSSPPSSSSVIIILELVSSSVDLIGWRFRRWQDYAGSDGRDIWHFSCYATTRFHSLRFHSLSQQHLFYCSEHQIIVAFKSSSFMSKLILSFGFPSLFFKLF